MPGLKRFPYQSVARPIAPPTAETVPDLTWALGDLPFGRLRLRLSGEYSLPLIALPYDLPLTAPPDLVRAKARSVGEGTPEWGRADVVVVPDLIALLPSLPLAPKRLPLHTQSPEIGRADAPPPESQYSWDPVILVAEGARWATVSSGETPPETPGS